MQAGKPLKVMIVDDTIVYRKIVSDVLSEIPGVRVVGAAHNGKAALLKIKALQPDLLTLDIEMPEMSGLELLERMRTEAPDVGAVMLSTLTQEGGAMTMRALELGAFDFIPKPQSGTMAENRAAVKKALEPILQAFSRIHRNKRVPVFQRPAKYTGPTPPSFARTRLGNQTRGVILDCGYRYFHRRPQCSGSIASRLARRYRCPHRHCPAYAPDFYPVFGKES